MRDKISEGLGTLYPMTGERYIDTDSVPYYPEVQAEQVQAEEKVFVSTYQTGPMVEMANQLALLKAGDMD